MFEDASLRPQNSTFSHSCRPLADRSTRRYQFIIGTLLGHKVIVSAFFNDGAARHDCDDVSCLDGGQPVSDDDAGSSFSCLIQSRLDRLQGHRANILSEVW